MIDMVKDYHILTQEKVHRTCSSYEEVCVRANFFVSGIRNRFAEDKRVHSSRIRFRATAQGFPPKYQFSLKLS